MAQVALRNVRKVYPNGFEAVKSLTLDIGDGEFVVLVGPSGCGKSTTLRMVAGLEEASGGEILIANRVVNDVHPKDRDIAMVFQNYALYPHMSVRKNMAFALKLRGMARAEIDQRVESAARVLGIEHLLDRKPRELSGGQKQRVAVGRAIVREPKAFLFDEPLSNLDAKLRVSTRAELKSLHQRLKTTTMYVTHDQEEAMTLGDRIVVMSNGEIQQCDAPLRVYQHPRNRFVAGFIGTPQMNFFSGRLKEEGGALKFVEDGPEGARLEFGLPPERQGLRSAVGPDVVLGLRPTMLKESPQGQAVRIRVVEPLGDAMDVSFETPSNPHVVARVPARVGLVPGESMRLTPDADLAHFFEPGEFGRTFSEGGV